VIGKEQAKQRAKVQITHIPRMSVIVETQNKRAIYGRDNFYLKTPRGEISSSSNEENMHFDS
jgi:hypothetical protein